jgi:hypothetical protein
MFKHPSKVCMTYFEHFKLSMGFSITFASASVQAFIHAIIPDVYTESTTNTINKVQEKIKISGCTNKEQSKPI